MRAFVVVIVLAAAMPALPCSIDFARLSDLRAIDLREPVPTNVVLLAFPFTGGIDGSLRIRPEGEVDSAPMVLDSLQGFVVIRTTEELTPRTRYEVLFDNERDEPAVVGTFETADGPDNDPPAAPLVARTESQEVFPHSDTCGTREGGTFLSFFVEPDGDTSALSVLLGDSPVAIDLVGDRDPVLTHRAVDEAGLTDYAVVAIDRAGNVSEPTIVPVDVGCPGACSSTSSAPLAIFGLALLRRRRS